ncbi:hypothetical protein [Sanyastnella coralliicola]|uniref:hypothetical protein n=1 Tax=Sanyastnella coralliicola TaxID=3069118 RepID=UPI0027BA8240|nr:hypothetical protein [Longitalea sp. SCSIO 12813]
MKTYNLQLSIKQFLLLVILLTSVSIFAQEEVQQNGAEVIETVTTTEETEEPSPEPTPTETPDPATDDAGEDGEEGDTILKVQFSEATDSLTRSSLQDVTVVYTLEIEKIPDGKTYTVDVKVLSSTTLNANEFSISTTKTSFTDADEGKKFKFFLTVPKDEMSDRNRQIDLGLIIKEGDEDKAETNTGAIQKMTIKVLPIAKLNDYNYLAYIGTNFDLVDGVEANKLFFATNLFMPNQDGKYGTYVSLYGNRSFSSTDSVTTRNFREDLMVGNDSITEFSRVADRRTTYQADNIGMQMSLLRKLGDHSASRRATKGYFMLTGEFIWRRSKTDYQYTNIQDRDTITYAIGESSPVDYSGSYNPNLTTIYGNQFDLNLGAGLMFDHSNDKISVRFQVGGGLMRPFSTLSSQERRLDQPFRANDLDAFYYGKIWITEPNAGLTVHAEIYNRIDVPTPYMVVTLSKAINFKSLGTIFEPVATR